MSRRIRALETELGHTLFERGRDGYRATDFATGIFGFVDTVAENIAAIDRSAFANEGGLAGMVRFSLLEELYHCVLAEPVSTFMSRHPLINLIVDTTSTLSDLGRREADVIVRITKEPPEQAFGRKVADSPLAGYASQTYLDNRPVVDRWIALDYAQTIDPLLHARPAFRSNSLSVVADTLARGQGIGLLPCFVGETTPGLVRVPEIPLKPDMEVWVLTHEDVRENPRVRALMDHLYQTFSQQRNMIEGGN
jgi:DNA-binding transcriptional LysR family regulator